MTDSPHDSPFKGIPENPDFAVDAPMVDLGSDAATVLPEPLGSTPPMLDYPVDALGPYLADKAKHIQAMTGADLRLVCQSMLAHVNLATQAIADVRRDGGTSLPISLAILSIARSGDGKSEVDRHTGQAFREVENEQWDDFEKALDEFKLDLECWEKDRSNVKNAKSAAKRAEAKAKLSDKPQRPLSPIRRVNTSTSEAMVSKLQNSFPSRGLFSDEAAIFLGGYSAREGKNAMLGTLTNLWAGEGVTSETKGDDNTTRIPGRRFAIYLQGQPEILHPFLMDRVATGQGLLPRCLWVEPETFIDEIRTPTATQLQARDNLTDTMRRLLLAELETFREGSDRILEPPALDLTDEARALSLAYTNETRIAANDGHEFSEVRGYAVRSGEQALRIMATLALFNRFAAGLSREALFAPLTVDEAQRGIDLARFYLHEVLRMRSKQANDDVDRLALDWRQKIHQQFGSTLFTRAMANSFSPGALRLTGTVANRNSVKGLRADVWAILLQTNNILPCGSQAIDGVNCKETFVINVPPD